MLIWKQKWIKNRDLKSWVLQPSCYGKTIVIFRFLDFTSLRSKWLLFTNYCSSLSFLIQILYFFNSIIQENDWSFRARYESRNLLKFNFISIRTPLKSYRLECQTFKWDGKIKNLTVPIAIRYNLWGLYVLIDKHFS